MFSSHSHSSWSRSYHALNLVSRGVIKSNSVPLQSTFHSPRPTGTPAFSPSTNTNGNGNGSATSSVHVPTPTSPSTFRFLSTLVGAPLRRKVTTLDVQIMKDKGKKISMVTAYTYPSAVHVDSADIDVLLVGDSVGMVEQGQATTLPVTVDELIYHCKSVSRGAERALLVADLPFGSYESSPQQAYATATRFLKEAGMDCVKLEGGAQFAAHVRALVEGGVAVMGHIGLTPQRISVLGGFRAQGKTLAAAQSLLADALALQDAGAFAIVLECVPAEVGDVITRSLRIPTIGIGAGPYTSGQVLVYHDLLGMFEHAHHAKVAPRFCKTYAPIGAMIQKALEEFKDEVVSQTFPSDKFSPYKLKDDEERKKFAAWAKQHLEEIERTKKTEDANTTSISQTDDTINLYGQDKIPTK